MKFDDKKTVADLFTDEGDFEGTLSEAEGAASGDWECDFVSDLRVKFDQYGAKMFLSERQLELLQRIASK